MIKPSGGVPGVPDARPVSGMTAREVNPPPDRARITGGPGQRSLTVCYPCAATGSPRALFRYSPTPTGIRNVRI
jgi:hypothetical protein